MSDDAFSADWLALREPFDRAARERAAAGLDWAALRAWLHAESEQSEPDGPNHPDRVFGLLDLGCGTGANLRELAPRLGGVQRWSLVDHDRALLAAMTHAVGDWARTRSLRAQSLGERLLLSADALQPGGSAIEAVIEPLCIDIARELDRLPFDAVRLVTCSALLDLVSASWLVDLVDRCRASGAALLCALSVDGRVEWSPRDPMDDAVHALFTAHQARDKGFGGASLGSAALPRAVALLRAAGYRVIEAQSDWEIDAARGPGDIAMLRAMVDGIAAAAADQAPQAQESVVASWRARRLAAIETSALVVGHRDLLALPQVQVP
ncbi:MAG: hypothetical protein ABW220_11545 [Burkholderiaceae bacterium]